VELLLDGHQELVDLCAGLVVREELLHVLMRRKTRSTKVDLRQARPTDQGGVASQAVSVSRLLYATAVTGAPWFNVRDQPSPVICNAERRWPGDHCRDARLASLVPLPPPSVFELQHVCALTTLPNACEPC
jgi:hypothetical protein